METTKDRLEFENWVSAKLIIGPGMIAVLFLALGLIYWAFLIPAGLLALITGYFAIARRIFSASGGDIQNRVQDLVVSHIEWDGSRKALDIGCGNGPLTVKLGQRYPKAGIVGVDFWGRNWDYSLNTCNENARLAGVEGRVTFQKASASKLPFEDASFDLVVSNLVFHEVQDVEDKRVSIHEALRVLKPGGVFVLQDLFLIKAYYGTPEELVNKVLGWGVKKAEFIRTCDEAFIPKWVKLPFMVGTLSILKGVK
jgi:ubiquinone/menaquinone biosynthesis C-methylase UbiE